MSALCLGMAAAREDETGKDDDQTFVMKASASDLAEVNLSRLATRRASNSSVKEFAEKMIADHTKTSKELIDMADKKRLKVATTMEEKHQKLSEKLSGLEGEKFDREFMTVQVKAHEEAVSLFEKQSKSGKDSDLKAWAKKTLPDLKHHLKMAKETRDKVKGSDRK